MKDRKHTAGGEIPELAERYDDHVDDAVALSRGELSAEAARAVRERIKSDPVYRAVVQPIVDAYKEPRLSDEDVELLWPRIVQRAGLGEHVVDETLGNARQRERARRIRLLWSVGRVAAGIILAIGLGAGVYLARLPLSFDTVSTSSTETLVKTLPDGSTATLGPGSELRYPERMTGGNWDRQREVWPRGEVTFDVWTDPRPGQAVQTNFEVITEQAQITAFGTRFKVVALPGITYVELMEGRLSIFRKSRSPDEPTHGRMAWLNAGQAARITAGDMVIGAAP